MMLDVTIIPYQDNNETDRAHISHVSRRFTYTYENEIRRELIKALQAAAIDPLLISSPPPHP